MATAKKLPSGNWRVLVYTGMADGKRQYKSFTASTKKQAEYDASLYMVRKHREEVSGPSVGQAIDRYIDIKSQVLSPRTIAGYRDIRRVAMPGVMRAKVADLDNEFLQRAVNDYSAEHAEKTVRNAVGLVTAALKLVAPDFKPLVTLPQRKKQEITIPDDDAVKRLLDAADGPMHSAVLLASALGLRRSEICALTWEDIGPRTIRISRAVVKNENGEWVTKATKTTSSTRTMDAPPFLIAALKKNKTHEENVVDIINPAALTLRFLKLRKRCGFTGRFHDLRHYYASLLLALGVPDLYAMRNMGHSTTNMLKTVYQHIVDEKQREVDASIREKMTELFG